MFCLSVTSHIKRTNVIVLEGLVRFIESHPILHLLTFNPVRTISETPTTFIRYRTIIITTVSPDVYICKWLDTWKFKNIKFFYRIVNSLISRFFISRDFYLFIWNNIFGVLRVDKVRGTQEQWIDKDGRVVHSDSEVGRRKWVGCSLKTQT